MVVCQDRHWWRRLQLGLAWRFYYYFSFSTSPIDAVTLVVLKCLCCLTSQGTPFNSILRTHFNLPGGYFSVSNVGLHADFEVFQWLFKRYFLFLLKSSTKRNCYGILLLSIWKTCSTYLSWPFGIMALMLVVSVCVWRFYRRIVLLASGDYHVHMTLSSLRWLPESDSMRQQPHSGRTWWG